MAVVAVMPAAFPVVGREASRAEAQPAASPAAELFGVVAAKPLEAAVARPFGAAAAFVVDLLAAALALATVIPTVTAIPTAMADTTHPGRAVITMPGATGTPTPDAVTVTAISS